MKGFGMHFGSTRFGTVACTVCHVCPFLTGTQALPALLRPTPFLFPFEAVHRMRLLFCSSHWQPVAGIRVPLTPTTATTFVVQGALLPRGLQNFQEIKIGGLT
jgi:hypothetical protein